MTHLELFFFGTPRLVRGGKRVSIRRRKVVALLAYLTVTNQPHSRDALAALLWPEQEQSTARANLRRNLSWLKKTLGDDVLVIDRTQVGLNARADLWLDVHEFQAKIKTAQQHEHNQESLCPDCVSLLTEAAAIYTDDFMAGFSLPDSPAFGEWHFFAIEGYQQLLLQALQQLIQWHMAQEMYEQGIEYGRRWLALDPLHEPAQRQLMRLYAQAGQYAAALRQYQECERLLQEELAVAPEEATTALYEAIRTKRFPPPKAAESAPPAVSHEEELPPKGAAPTAVAPANDATSPTPNLPPQPTSFIGRKKELARIRHLLLENPTCRLLTLIGPGGIGKTRLAVQAASMVSEAFPDGVYFVGMASVNQAAFIISALAESLHLTFSTGSIPKTQLLRYLSDKQLLLVIDNFEHLLDGALLLAEILTAAPQVTILVTSREKLNLQEEWNYEVQGMQTPPTAELAQNEILQSAAVRLFDQRARQTSVNFTLTSRDMAAVVRICQLVDGMPLGIELAAGWVSSLSCAEIAEELSQNLDLLETSLQNVPARHRNLRAVFEHSWRLLREDEQTVFARLSIFRGGFTRQAARQIADATLPGLLRLVGKSLLHHTPDERYDIHELLRQYAVGKLDEIPAHGTQTRDAHGRYYGAFLQDLQGDLHREKQQETFQKIEDEIENIRAGWQWAVDHLHSDPSWIEVLDQYVVPLFHFYDTRSQFQKGVAMFSQAAVRLEAALAAIEPGRREQVVAGKILGRQGWFAFHLGHHEQAKQLLQRSSEMLLALNEREEAVFSLNYLGAVRRHLGEYEIAQQHLETSLVICREVGDRFGSTVALNVLGQIAYLRGEFERARHFCQESLSIKRELGDQWGMTFSLSYLGTVAQAQGDYEEAQTLFKESMEISKQIGDQRGVATSLNNLGDIAAVLGQLDTARETYHKSLAVFKKINNLLGVVAALTKLGDLAREEGRYELAWKHFREALQIAQTLQVTPQVLNTLTSVALLWQGQGNWQQSLSLLVLAANHTVSSQENRDRAKTLLAELTAQRHFTLPALPAQPDMDKAVTNAITKMLEA